jgi:kexin
MRLLPMSLSILNGMLLLSDAKPSKRDWSSYNYYAIEHIPQAGEEFNALVQTLGMEVVERVGELPNTWLVRSPASSNGEQAPATIRSRSIHSGIAYLEQQTLRQRAKRDGKGLHSWDDIHSSGRRAAVDIANAVGIKDPEFVNQWHLFNDEIPANSMNVSGVWEAGITGKGVISAMVDDGVDYSSDDLKENFVRGLGYC